MAHGATRHQGSPKHDRQSILCKRASAARRAQPRAAQAGSRASEQQTAAAKPWPAARYITTCCSDLAGAQCGLQVQPEDAHSHRRMPRTTRCAACSSHAGRCGRAGSATPHAGASSQPARSAAAGRRLRCLPAASAPAGSCSTNRARPAGPGGACASCVASASHCAGRLDERPPRTRSAEVRARALAGVCGMQGSGRCCAGAHLRSASRHASDPLLARPSSRAAPGCACARRLGSHGHARALAGRRAGWRTAAGRLPAHVQRRLAGQTACWGLAARRVAARTPVDGRGIADLGDQVTPSGSRHGAAAQVPARRQPGAQHERGRQAGAPACE